MFDIRRGTNNYSAAKADNLGVDSCTLTKDFAHGGLVLLERFDTLISEYLPVGCAVVDLGDLRKGPRQ